MFTGIIEETGSVASIAASGDGAVLRIECDKVLEGVQLGDSIAVNGVCLTVSGLDAKGFSADVMRQTLDLTTLGARVAGDRLNLERAMTATSRLGGHFVQGHVDCTAALLERRPGNEWTVLRFELPASVAHLVAARGSVAVDGVSLTVSAVADDWFEVSLIPTTLSVTTLGGLEAGQRVNLETDVMARQLDRIVQVRGV